MLTEPQISSATESGSRDAAVDMWLESAFRGLCDTAKMRIRSEIVGHIADATEEGIRQGLRLSEAFDKAVRDLGDPAIARRTFARRHLTQREAAVIARQKLPHSRLGTVRWGTRIFLFPVGLWLSVILCLAECSTLMGRPGSLSGREAILIAPWVVWLTNRVLRSAFRHSAEPGSASSEVRRRLLAFYSLMWSSSLAMFASTDGRVVALGTVCLLGVIGFSISRLPLAVKLHRVNALEVSAYYGAAARPGP